MTRNSERNNAALQLLLLLLILTLTLKNLQVVDAAGSVPEGFIDEVVGSTKAISGIFVANPRSPTNQPMMILNDKNGLVHVLENPDESPKDMEILDLRGRICTNGERGLMSLAAHPNFAENRWIYAFYTKYRQDCLEDAELGPWNVVTRFTMDPATLELNVDEAVEIWRGAVLPKRLHNGGAMAFGNDGKLYITTGDAGERSNAASLQNVHGCLLRINDDGSIPDDNPYTPQSGFFHSYSCSKTEGRVPSNAPDGSICSEIYASGLRNPFRLAMDPNVKTKVKMAIGDVGAQHIESLFYGGTDYKGARYPWPTFEGPCEPGNVQSCPGLSDPNVAAPFHWYEHVSTKGDGGCVAGSAFVPDGLWPSQFQFLFIDFVFLKVYNLELDRPDRACADCSPPLPPTRNETFYRSFRKEGQNVNEARMTSMFWGPYKDTTALYLTKYGNQETIVRIRFTGSTNKPPHPLFDFVIEPDNQVRFDASRSFDPDDQDTNTLTYQWDYGDGSPKEDGVRTLHKYQQSGEYTVTLQVSDSTGQAQTLSKTVKIGQPPSVAIISPTPQDLFSVGEVLQLKGEAFDVSGNPISIDQLEWEVRQHHSDHWHPFLDLSSGNDFELYPAPEPEDYLAATNSFLRVLLTATDDNGLSHTEFVDVQPRKVRVNVNTIPEGLDIVVDDYKIQSPETVTSWVGFNLPLHVEDQELNDQKFLFQSWSDGNQNRTRSANLVSNVVTQQFTAMFCLGLEAICTSTSECCSGHCDEGLCKPPIITERPSVRPVSAPTLSPLEEFTSLTAKPTIPRPTANPTTVFLPPPARPSSETPPLDLDIGDPLDDENGSLNSENSSSSPKDTLSSGMSMKNIWLVSLLIILLLSIVVWGWCRYHEATKHAVYEDSSSIQSNPASEPEVPNAQSFLQVDGYHTPIKEIKTATTDGGSEKSLVLSSCPREAEGPNQKKRTGIGGDLDSMILAEYSSVQGGESDAVPILEDSTFVRDLENQSYPNRSEETSCLLMNRSAFTYESPERGMSSDFSSILDYPVPQNNDDAAPPIAESDMYALSAAAFQLSQTSLLLNPSLFVEDSELNQSERQSLHEQHTTDNNLSMEAEDVDEVPHRHLATLKSSIAQEIASTMEIREGDRRVTADSRLQTEPVESPSGRHKEAVSDIGNDVSPQSLSTPPRKCCDKSRGVSDGANEERKHCTSSGAHGEISTPSVVRANDTPLSQEANSNAPATPTSYGCLYETPIFSTAQQSKALPVSATFTGATVSPTPEKSVCSDEYGDHGNEAILSCQTSLSDEFLAAQHLAFDEDETDTSLYSC